MNLTAVLNTDYWCDTDYNYLDVVDVSSSLTLCILMLTVFSLLLNTLYSNVRVFCDFIRKILLHWKLLLPHTVWSKPFCMVQKSNLILYPAYQWFTKKNCLDVTTSLSLTGTVFNNIFFSVTVTDYNYIYWLQLCTQQVWAIFPPFTPFLKSDSIKFQPSADRKRHEITREVKVEEIYWVTQKSR